MDREEFMKIIRTEIQQRFLALTEEEKEVVRENRDTEYAQILRTVLGPDILQGLRTRQSERKQNITGLGAPV